MARLISTLAATTAILLASAQFSMGSIATAEESVAAEEDRLVVVADISEASQRVIRTAYALATGAKRIEFIAVAPERLELWALGEGSRFDVMVGYPLPLLERLRIAGHFAPSLAPPLPIAPALASLPIAPLFFDPIAIVQTQESQRLHGETRLRLEDLALPRWEGMVLLENPSAGNVSGGLLAAIVGASGGFEEAMKTLRGLDANRLEFRSTTRDLLDRLVTPGLDPVIGVVSHRRVRTLYPDGGEMVVELPPGIPGGELLGVAIGKESHERGGEFYGVLSQPNVITRVAVLDQVVPLSSSIADSDLPEWMSPVRDQLREHASLVAMNCRGEADIVTRFRDEVSGEFGRRSDAFSEYYDAIAIVLMVLVVIWLFRRPKVEEEPESFVERTPSAEPPSQN